MKLVKFLKIHTPSDTLRYMGSTAQHLTHFAKLEVAFAVDLSK